jgi:ribosomal protein S7
MRKEKKWSLKLFQEFYDIIFNQTGKAFLKKKETYKYAVLFKTAKKFKW